MVILDFMLVPVGMRIVGMNIHQQVWEKLTLMIYQHVGVKAANMAGFDGWLDEFRVSNVVRGFDNAPVLAEHGWANGNPGYLGKRNPYTGAGTHTVNIDVTQFVHQVLLNHWRELFYNSRASLADSIGPGDASFQSVQMTHTEGGLGLVHFQLGQEALTMNIIFM